MSNVATRLLSLILMLQSQESWKASELGAELGVSERTVHRYMEMLEEMGIPIYTERGPYGGFALLRGYRLPPLIFTAAEATVLTMGANLVQQIWGRSYQDAITSVRAKLNNVLPDDLRQEVAEAQDTLVICGLTARDYQPWEGTLRTLRESIHHHQRVSLRYRGFSQIPTSREVDPYALSFYGGLWYLVGFCHLRRELRTFRVDRIQELTLVHARFEPPRDFSARDYMLRTMQFEARTTATVRLESAVAMMIRERFGHWMEITDQDDGSVIARFGMDNLNWATGWVLSWGTMATVLEPPELVDRVRQEVRALAGRYGERVG